MQRGWFLSVTLILCLLLFRGVEYTAQSPDSLQRPTLPPTWTPTFTPTATDTPTITPTFTPTATLSPEQICEQFIVVDDQGAGYSYAHDLNFDLFIGTTVPNTTMRFFAEHRLSEEGIGAAQIQPIPLTTLTVPIASLPRAGLYDWTMALIDNTGEVLCEDSGYFFAGRPEWVTPQAPTVTPLTVTPVYIIVTATPTPEN